MSNDTINIENVDKAELLAALYNNSKPLGMGMLHYDPTPMSKEEAESLLEEQTFFDYLKGRVMKVDLSSSEMRTFLYDRDNGQGAAKKVLESIV